MSVKLTIITHEQVGKSLINIVTKIFNGQLPIPTHIIAISDDTDIEPLINRLKQPLDKSRGEEGVLVLTDMFGSTPCNVAHRLLDIPTIRLVTGLNLPMLIRVMNYPDLGLSALAEKAVSGGREGVMECKKKP